MLKPTRLQTSPKTEAAPSFRFAAYLHSTLTNRSRVVQPESLCISPGKAVYTLYIDVVCINYDGNAFDAAVMAVMAALRNSMSFSLRHDQYPDIAAALGQSQHTARVARGSYRCWSHFRDNS